MEKSQSLHLNTNTQNKNQAQQQNININISYNLNTHKLPKSILGAKKTTNKNKKLHQKVIQPLANQFFSNIALNAISEGKKVVKKQNQSKKSNQISLSYKQSKGLYDKQPKASIDKQFKEFNEKKNNAKSKKAKQISLSNIYQKDADFNNSFHNCKDILKRNIQSPDIFKIQNNRKIKTQASYGDAVSTLKKGKKQSIIHKQDKSLSTKDHDKYFIFKQSKSIKQNAKINNWMKQTSNPLFLNKITTNPMKKSGSSKTPKNKKSIGMSKQKQRRIHTQENQIPNHYLQNKHNKSCMLYSNKKGNIITQPNFVETAQHIMSTYVNGNKAPRKRAQSAYAFRKNDKQLVAKLLNMSIISSQLGSSQLISSQRTKSSRNQITKKRFGLKVDQLQDYNHNQLNETSSYNRQNQFRNRNEFESSVPGNALRQYLNSIDLRVIKNIEDDRATIEPQYCNKDINQNQHLALIQNQLSSRDIQNNYKSKKNDEKRQSFIQKNINKKQKNTQNSNLNSNNSRNQTKNIEIISFYNKLFENALQNKRIQQQQDKYLQSANITDKANSQDLNRSSKLKKQKFIIQGFDEDQLEINQQSSREKQLDKKRKIIEHGIQEIQNQFQNNLFFTEQRQFTKQQNNLKFKHKNIQLQSSQSDNNSIRQIYENINFEKNNAQNPKQQIPAKNSLKLSFNNYKQILNQHAHKVQQEKKQLVGNKIQKPNGNQNSSSNSSDSKNNFVNQNKNQFCFELKSCQFTDQPEISKIQIKYTQNQAKHKFHQSLNKFNQILNQKANKLKERENHLQQTQNDNFNRQFNQAQHAQSKNQSDYELAFCKQEQLQRWNNINQFLSKKINQNYHNNNENNLIMQELIKQSNWNKKWIQQQELKSQNNSSQQKDKQIFNVNESKDAKVPQKGAKKSPKNSLIQKRKSKQNKFQSYNEVCWEYNAQQLQKQIQKYASAQKQQQKQTKKQNIYDRSSPNNFSQDGNGSGQQQYDSKKYSQGSTLKDQVIQYHMQVQQQSSSNQSPSPFIYSKQQEHIESNLISSQPSPQTSNSHRQFKEKLQNKNEQNSQDAIPNQGKDLKIVYQKQQDRLKQKQLIKRLIDSFDQEEQEEISCEDKQIHSEDRWISYNASNMNAVNKNPAQNNYLECQLSNFGVNHKRQNKNQSQFVFEKHQANKQPKNYQNIEPKICKTKNIEKQNEQMNELLQLNDVLKMIQSQQNDIEAQFVRMNSQKQDISKNSIKNYQNNKKNQLNIQQSNHNSQLNQNVSISQSQTHHLQSNQPEISQNSDRINSIKKKRLTHIVEDIILQLIRQFARDISYILKKSTSQQKQIQKQFEQNTSPFRLEKEPNDYEKDLSPFYRADQQFQSFSPHNKKQQILKRNQFLGRTFGIDTSFHSIQKYLKEFKAFLLADQKIKQEMVRNINKDIGPNSLQILSYLRPEYENSQKYQMNENGSMSQDKMDHFSECQDEDGLFIVPSQAFSQYENYIQQKRQQQNKLLQQQKQVILTQKQKRNLNYWHRGIYESWNQFLDCQRPFGINGKPYDWVQQRKKFRQIKPQEIQTKLQKGIQKLLQAISLPTGIIYDKYDIQAMYSDLGQQQKIFLNQERLSRMLAIQLLESQQLWINYNDEMAELLVELSRIIQETLIFEISAQFKKLMRKRNCLAN